MFRNIGENKLFYEQLISSNNSSSEEEIGSSFRKSKRAREVDRTEEDNVNTYQEIKMILPLTSCNLLQKS